MFQVNLDCILDILTIMLWDWVLFKICGVCWYFLLRQLTHLSSGCKLLTSLSWVSMSVPFQSLCSAIQICPMCVPPLWHLGGALSFSSALKVVMLVSLMSLHVQLGWEPRGSSITLWNWFCKLLSFWFLQHLAIPWLIFFFVLLESCGFFYPVLPCTPTTVSAYRNKCKEDTETKAMGFAPFFWEYSSSD